MGNLVKGNITSRRYVVLGDLPGDLRRRFVAGVRAHAFVPIDPRSEETTSRGWVSVEDEDDADLQAKKLFFGRKGSEQLRVAIRMDTLTVPADEVRRQLKADVAKVEEIENRKVSRMERRAMKEAIQLRLRPRAFPKVRTFDVCWELDAARLWFWSQSKACNESLADLFVKSFGLRLEVEGVERWVLDVLDAKRSKELTPTTELWTGFEGVRPLGSATREA